MTMINTETRAFTIEQWLAKLKSNWYKGLVQKFQQIYPSADMVYILRIPARINLMGVHIEHRGGYVNYMAVDKEAVFIIHKRADDKIVVSNANAKYPTHEFHISAELPKEKRGDWMNYIQQTKIQAGEWLNYIKSGVLVIQDRVKDKELLGMDILIDSTIPVGSGLSSSSSLVVGSALAISQINTLNISPEDMVELCGIGEWYVGTRGGAGDHAAMLLSRENHILHTHFFPFEYDHIPFPDGYKVVACNSFVKAVKSKEVKNKFNEKVATYEIGMLMIAENYPEESIRFKHLRDVLLEDDLWIYSMLKTLPKKITRRELKEQFPNHLKELETIYATHDEPEGGYRVRSVMLFGLAECRRGEICVDFIKKGNMASFGKLMYISHDGDRIVKYDSKGNVTPWTSPDSDEYLDGLIKGINSGSPQSKLFLQPGGYGCSCVELDKLVDIDRETPGVLGAGLTGAGMGGCVLVLVKEDAAKLLLERMKQLYYDARGSAMGAELCVPADGARFLLING